MSITRNHVIGGISGGIGAALAEQLRDSGANIAGFSRHPSNESEYIHACDATDPEQVESCLTELQKELGSIDSYTHAIGSILLKPAHLTSVEDWQTTLLQNLSSAFYALKVVSKIMMKQGHGSCVFFSTAAAKVGLANHEAVAAAKGGIEAMVRSAAATYGARGVRINAIAPSLTQTPLSEPITSNPQALEISKRMHPLGDISQPNEIASLAKWLHSDAARLTTGQTFVVDGGISSIVPKPRA